MPDDKLRESMVDEYRDAGGIRRRFELRQVGPYLEAIERKPNGGGLRFIVPTKPDGPEPWGELRDKIRERLSQRDLVRDEDGELHDLHRVIRAQLTSSETRRGPLLLVDDLEVTWEEMGKLLMTYEGWGLRMELRECGEE